MIEQLEFLVDITSMYDNLAYQVLRLKSDLKGNLTMTLANGDVLHLDVGQTKWYEFTTWVHSSDFHMPKYHQTSPWHHQLLQAQPETQNYFVTSGMTFRFT